MLKSQSLPKYFGLLARSQLIPRMIVPIATLSAVLAFLSGFLPIITGHVDWHQATTFTLSPHRG
jgi:hypothetical protein